METKSNNVPEKKVFDIRKAMVKYGLFVLVISMIVIISIISKDFRTVDNFLNVFKQISINGVLAIGMTFVIITGGIDLSVGSTVALASLIAGAILQIQPDNPVFTVYALVAALAVSAAFGCGAGLFIALAKIPPFVVTLAFTSIIKGVGYVFCDGKPFIIRSESFRVYGQGNLGPIPVPTIILIVVFLLFFFILNFTKFGRYVYATGGNESAAITSGVNTKKVKIIVYTISGTMAGLAGVMLGSRLNSGNPTLGTGYELDAIAAVVIGGASLEGGIGNLLGTLLGIVTLGIINNAMNLLGVSSYYQMIAKGIIILIAVLMDVKTKGLKTK